MKNSENKKFGMLRIFIFAVLLVSIINPILGLLLAFLFLFYLIKNPNVITSHLSNIFQNLSPELMQALKNNPALAQNLQKHNISVENTLAMYNTVPTTYAPSHVPVIVPNTLVPKLQKRKKYLHIALNNTLEEAREIISRLPSSDRILIEVGTPILKIYGTNAIHQIKAMAPFGTYIVADNKCADLAPREVEMMAHAGAHAATCLGVAPLETIESFINSCQKFGIDSIIDMMNVENALLILSKLKKLPKVVMLHRGVDETAFSKEKQLPLYQIKQIKGKYNVLVAVAGGDTIREVQRSLFNDADIVVVWKNFFQASSDTATLAESFLKTIKTN